MHLICTLDILPRSVLHLSLFLSKLIIQPQSALKRTQILSAGKDRCLLSRLSCLNYFISKVHICISNSIFARYLNKHFILYHNYGFSSKLHDYCVPSF